MLDFLGGLVVQWLTAPPKPSPKAEWLPWGCLWVDIEAMRQENERIRVERATRALRPKPRYSPARELSRYHKALDILPGHVYLISDQQGGYKIGLSANVDNRVRDLERQRRAKLTVLHTVRCDVTHLLEHALHQHYAHKNLHHEWFALSERDIEAFKALPDGLGREDIEAVVSSLPR